MPKLKTTNLLSILLVLLSNIAIADSIKEFKTEVNLSSLVFKDTLSADFLSDKKFAGLSRTITLPSEDSTDPQIISVNRNSKAITYSSHRFAGGFYTTTLKDSGEKLPQGNYTFDLSYTLSNPVKIQDDKAVLEWSVNSKFWNIPIKKILASVILPAGISSKLIKHHAYTILDGKKDLTSAQSTIVSERGKLLVNYYCQKTLSPGEEFVIYLEYPKPKSILPEEGKALTADSAETIVVNGKTVTIGKSVSLGAQPEAASTPTTGQGADGETIKIGGKEIKVGKTIKLEGESTATEKSTSTAQAPSNKIKIDGKEVTLGNSIKLEEKTEPSSTTITPSGKKIEVGKSIKLEE